MTQNFEPIAGIWTAYLGSTITVQDVEKMFRLADYATGENRALPEAENKEEAKEPKKRQRGPVNKEAGYSLNVDRQGDKRYTPKERRSRVLTELQKSEIKWLALEGKTKQLEIAKMYGINYSTVSHIKTGHKAYKDVKPVQPDNGSIDNVVALNA